MRAPGSFTRGLDLPVTYRASYRKKNTEIQNKESFEKHPKSFKGTYRVTYRACEVIGTSEKRALEKPFRRTSEGVKPLPDSR